MKAKKSKPAFFNYLSALPLLIVSLLFAFSVLAGAYSSNQKFENCNHSTSCSISTVRLANACGAGSGLVQTSINFGCTGNNCSDSHDVATGTPAKYCSEDHNGITDLIFAIIRFLSDGVGLVIIASVMVGGIQYIGARGDPNNTGLAIKRITSALIALLVFIFAYAILNYVIPGGFFNQ